MPRQIDPASAIQCFRAGRHVALSGAALTFAASDLEATARAYDPAKHEAPIVVGHPALDAPAYGWVRSLHQVGDALEALPRKVDPVFAEAVRRGAYGKVSAAFFTPDAPGNPSPGVYYLRHVGFLGAASPAVKGMRDPVAAIANAPAYADLGPGVVVFSEWDDVTTASLLRSLRDWILSKFGAADADSALPGYLVSSVEQGAQQELRDSAAEDAIATAPAFAAGKPASLEITDVTEAQKQALEAENARLRQQIADQAAAAVAARNAAARADAVAFADGLVAAGRLADGDRAVVVEVVERIARGDGEAGAVIQFAQADGAQAPLLPALKALFAAAPPRAPTGTVATTSSAAGTTGQVAFAAPPGFTVDNSRLALHQRALQYQVEHPGTEYSAAVAAVQRQA